ncbi:hypothetical protein R6Q57_029799 [Mikania cordata]
MNPFNTLGYRPQMPSPNQPNFYYEQMKPSQYLQYSPDYRDHTQDDLDSSDHNKSVQVESKEEGEEPVTDYFHQLMKDNSRTLDQIYSKWNDFNPAMKK